jgi:transcription antitermination factor NusG
MGNSVNAVVALNSLELWGETPQPRWYAAYTCPHRERRVADHLAARSVEHFLPLHQSMRRWKDRRKLMQLPLFPGYIFVRIILQDRLQVLEVPGVVRLVGFNHLPEALSDDEVNTLRIGLAQAAYAQPHRYLHSGRRVRISRGPFAGLDGILIRQKGRVRVVLSIELIQRSVLVDVDTTCLAAWPSQPL